MDQKKNIDKKISQKGITTIQAKDKTSLDYNKDTWKPSNQTQVSHIAGRFLIV